ncbi:MAG TPA: hypothetical protein VH877_32695 [Polyangia bacterium]|nr:hypothetical protein [Polyangia bacterium]
MMMRSLGRWMCLCLSLAACKGRGGVETGPINADAFNLGVATSLIQDNKVKNAQDFERAINRRNINRADVDHDGRVDPIQVVETQDDDRRTFTLRAIPTSAKGQEPDKVAVPVATIDFVPDRKAQRVNVQAHYAPIVVGGPPFAFFVPVVYQGDVIVAPTGSFFYWLLVIQRPIYVGVIYVDVQVYDDGHYKHKHRHK